MKLGISRSGPGKFIRCLIAIICATCGTCRANSPPPTGANNSPPTVANNQSPTVASGPAVPESQEQEAAQIPPDQLDSLVAPIALYPDPLLAQTLAAST